MKTATKVTSNNQATTLSSRGATHPAPVKPAGDAFFYETVASLTNGMDQTLSFSTTSDGQWGYSVIATSTPAHTAVPFLDIARGNLGWGAASATLSTDVIMGGNTLFTIQQQLSKSGASWSSNIASQIVMNGTGTGFSGDDTLYSFATPMGTLVISTNWSYNGNLYDNVSYVVSLIPTPGN